MIVMTDGTLNYAPLVVLQDSGGNMSLETSM